MLHRIWCSFFLSQEKNPVFVHTYLISCIDLCVCVRICSILDILITVVSLVIFVSNSLWKETGIQLPCTKIAFAKLY